MIASRARTNASACSPGVGLRRANRCRWGGPPSPRPLELAAAGEVESDPPAYADLAYAHPPTLLSMQDRRAMASTWLVLLCRLSLSFVRAA